MSIRLPSGADPDTLATFRDIEQQLEELRALKAPAPDAVDVEALITRIEQLERRRPDNALDAFVGSGPQSGPGLVPGPGGTADNEAVLGENGSWGYPVRGLVRAVTKDGAVGDTQYGADVIDVLGSLAVLGGLSTDELMARKLNVPAIACRLNRVADQTITSGVATSILFTNESYDSDDMHSTSSNTSRITFQTAGLYLVGGMFHFAADTTGTYRYLYLLLNGDTNKYLSVQYHPSTLGTDAKETTVLRYFAAGDYVELQAHHDASTNIAVKWQSNGEYTPIFWAVRLGM